MSLRGSLSDRGNLLAAPRALRMGADSPALGDSPAILEVDCFVAPPVKEVVLKIAAKEGQTRLRSYLATLASVPLLLSFLGLFSCSFKVTSLFQFPAKRVRTRNDR